MWGVVVLVVGVVDQHTSLCAEWSGLMDVGSCRTCDYLDVIAMASLGLGMCLLIGGGAGLVRE